METQTKPPVSTHRSLKRSLVRILIGVFLGSAVLSGTLLLLIASLGEQEKRYDGKPLSAWLRQIQSGNSALSNQANRVLTESIIPQLSRSIFEDTNDSRVRIELVNYLNTLPGVNILYRTADTRRADAAAALGEFGPPAKGAAPALLRALTGSDLAVRAPAGTALGKMQAEPTIVIPLLVKYLDDQELNARAALALAEYGALATSAVPKLIELSRVRDKDLHHAVIVALTRIDPAAVGPSGIQ